MLSNPFPPSNSTTDAGTPDDNTDLNASTSAHGLLLKATAPAAGSTSVVGIENGETIHANKTILIGIDSIEALSDSAYAALSGSEIATRLYITTG